MAVCRCLDMQKCQMEIAHLMQAKSQRCNAITNHTFMRISTGMAKNDTKNGLVIDRLLYISQAISETDNEIDDDNETFFDAIEKRHEELDSEYYEMEKEDTEYHEEEEAEICPDIPQ